MFSRFIHIIVQQHEVEIVWPETERPETNYVAFIVLYYAKRRKLVL